MSERRPACPAHVPDMDEDEYEDDKPLVRPASRKKTAKTKRDLDTDDEDLLPLVPPRLPPAAPVRKRKLPPVWQDPAATLDMRYQKTRASEQKIPQFWAEEQKVKPYVTFFSKLSDERNLRDLHLKHYHTSTAQFKKRTTHLNIPGNIYDLYQHVVNRSPFCNSLKPRLERSRVSGFRAEKFGDLIFLDRGSAKIRD